MPDPSGEAPVLVAQGIRKHFGGVEALRGIDLVVHRREIVGLAGDNGAGKSTFMKIVAGVHPPYSGTLVFEGQRIDSFSPQAALRRGIDTVYQELALCDNLDIRENIFLGRELQRRTWTGFKVLDYRTMTDRAEKLLQRLGIDAQSMLEPVATLSGGQRQAVAISRALNFGPRLVLLDEPTAALSINAAKPLLDLVRRLPSEGAAVLLVSHRLDDLLETTNRIYVLRHGVVAAEVVTAKTNGEELLRLMAGLPGSGVVNK